jgi:hypothetical protein
MAVITTARDTAPVSSSRDRLDIALERIGHRSSPVFRDRLATAFDETGPTGPPTAFLLVTPLNRTQRRAIVRAAGKLVAANPALAAWALEEAVREQFPAEVLCDSLSALRLMVGGLDELYRATGRLAAELAEELECERLVA